MATAKEAYSSRRTTIKKLISGLENKLKRHSEKQNKNPTDWGLVADLGYVKEQLENLIKFIK